MPRKKAQPKAIAAKGLAPAEPAAAPHDAISQLRAESGQATAFPQHLATGLSQLLQAFDYAADVGTDTWQLAVEIAVLRTAGFTTNDFRWLVLKGYLQHGHETTVYGDFHRSFRVGVGAMFLKTTSFVLTPAAAESLRSSAADAALPVRNEALPTGSVSSSDSSSSKVPNRASLFHPASDAIPGPHGCAPIEPRILPHSDVPLTLPGRFLHDFPLDTKPVWEDRKRELWVGKVLVKKFRVPADNQEKILAAFQEEAWPNYVDDPLPMVPEIVPKRRLHNVICRLNGSQLVPVLRFHGSGNGETIGWQFLPPVLTHESNGVAHGMEHAVSFLSK